MPTLTDLATSIAKKFDIPVNIFHSLIGKESTWRPNATGAAGEMGLTQLLPATAQAYGVTSPYDPTQNLEGGARYLVDLYSKYGNWQGALSAYNSGSPNSPAGLAYATSVLQGAGIGTGAGIQPVGAGGAPSTAHPLSGISGYAIAIVMILVLVALGTWAVIKGQT